MHAPSHGASTAYLGHCLVTGAAGFLGKQLVQTLLQRGLRVRALVRNTPLTLQHDRLECLSGDIQNSQQMDLLVRALIRCFIQPPRLPHSAVALSHGRIGIRPTRSMLRELKMSSGACQAHGVRRLIYTSSVDTCFNGEEDLHMDEHTAYATHFSCVYQETKVPAEQSVLAANTSGGLLTCALRPDGIWGLAAV